LACAAALPWAGCAASDTAPGFDAAEAEDVLAPAVATSGPVEPGGWSGDGAMDFSDLAADESAWGEDDPSRVDPADLERWRAEAARAAGLSVSGPGARAAGAPRIADRPARSVSAPAPAGVSEETWTIGIKPFTGPNARALAEEGLRRVRSTGGLPRATLRPRSGGWVIVYGSYEDPASAEAQRDLERVRSVEVNGSRPFAASVLMPPDVAATRGSLARYDLRRARAAYGPEALYTLQVGVYGKLDGMASPSEREGFRRAAEQAVADLRREGELAFFYHAPNRSMVTVGVFSEDDHDAELGLDSARLRGVRERFPHNLFNGKGIRESARTRDGGKAQRLQPSVLVGIPEG